MLVCPGALTGRKCIMPQIKYVLVQSQLYLCFTFTAPFQPFHKMSNSSNSSRYFYPYGVLVRDFNRSTSSTRSTQTTDSTTFSDNLIEPSRTSTNPEDLLQSVGYGPTPTYDLERRNGNDSRVGSHVGVNRAETGDRGRQTALYVSSGEPWSSFLRDGRSAAQSR